MFLNSLKCCALFLAIFVSVLMPGIAQANRLITTSAEQAIVLDYETGTVLFEKNADVRMPTSSMSKVMTMYVVFKALKAGDIALDQTFVVSEKAWRKGGSKMFIEVGKEVVVEDLIRGVIIQSGNDASIALAEGIAGSEDAFAQMLNAHARALGMENSQFMNASGWPDPNHYSTARDLAKLAYALVKEFPEYYDYYSEQEFSYNDITQRNRNPLLYREIGADGIKTGHTEDGGYGLIGSGEWQGRRVIMVLNGLESSQARAQESSKMLEWGLKNFENRTLFVKGDVIEHVPVLMSPEKSFPAVVQKDVVVTVPRLNASDIKVTTVLGEDSFRAPLAKGADVGEMTIAIPGLSEQSVDLFASKDVPELGFFAKTLEEGRLYIMNLVGAQ